MRQVEKLHLRVPPDLKAWADEQAKIEDRSLNAFMVRMMRQAKAEVEQAAAR